MRRFTLILTACALALYSLSGVVQVRSGERAVVRRFGRVLAENPEPGLWIGLPWGMDRVDRVAVDRVQSVVVGFQDVTSGELTMPPGQLLTGDHNLVNVQATLFYKVRQNEVVDYVVAGERVEPALTRAAETAMAEWVASRTVDEVLLRGKQSLGRALIAAVSAQIDEYDLGIEVLDARVGLIAPPEEVKHAFDDVARAQTGIATLHNRAEQEAEAALRTAQADRYRLEQSTAAHRYNQVTLARREAERFLGRLERYREGKKTNPHYLRQIWEEERGRVFAKLKENGQLGLLDQHLGPDGLDLSVVPSTPKR